MEEEQTTSMNSDWMNSIYRDRLKGQRRFLFRSPPSDQSLSLCQCNTRGGCDLNTSTSRQLKLLMISRVALCIHTNCVEQFYFNLRPARPDRETCRRLKLDAQSTTAIPCASHKKQFEYCNLMMYANLIDAFEEI